MKSDLTELRDYIKQCHQSGNELAVEMLIKMRNVATQASSDSFEIHLPMVERGRKELKDGRKANEKAYGTLEERQIQYRNWQASINALHREDPSATYGELQKRVADQYGVGESTVEKYTTNPKKKSE